MKSLIVLAAFTVICSAKYIVDVKGKLPCQPCDQDEIPLIQFKLLNPVCGPCGEMYGPSFEYCCMCDHKIRRACADAIRKWRMKINFIKLKSMEYFYRKCIWSHVTVANKILFYLIGSDLVFSIVTILISGVINLCVRLYIVLLPFSHWSFKLLLYIKVTDKKILKLILKDNFCSYIMNMNT